ncbi:Peptidase A1 [Macleaya cordata]|uniref:Peptidase A1 n=1 Tax=Macleaya cordata TaxID=56857 RepID=A0A200QA64_MACCD|nr:Peptidase A1 [Macleaya cordata]
MVDSKAIVVLMVVVVLDLLTDATTTTTFSAASTGPSSDFQLLNVKETIAGTKLRPSTLSDYQELSTNNKHREVKDKWKLKLVHRDVISAGKNHSDHRTRFHQRMKRDVKRVAGLNRRLSSGGTTSYGGGEANYQVEDFGSEVISGMDQGSGEYFVRIGVGSPPRSQYMVIDSGSDIVWVQCQPCSQCYHQSDPVFDPANSASFAGVACTSTVCDRLENAGCHAGRCRYEVSYGDGSYTKGTLALETLTFGRTVVRNVAIGCGHRNRGMFIGAAGLLGLGGGSMSFVGQLGGQTGGAFGYCLVSRGTGSYGSMIFGRRNMPVGAVWIPLIRNPRAPSFYYVGLSGLGVGGTRVPVSEEVFQLSESGYGGVIMDTGTAVTRLPSAAYEALRDSFIAGTTNLPRTSPVSIFDTCYDLFDFAMVRVPTVSFYFSSGPVLTLPARNFLIPVDEMGTFCFAFAPTSGPGIIGNIQQEGIQISFDGANGFVGFGPNTC